MIRFVSRILMISTFFIGLGAIADTAWKSLSPNNSECRRTIKIDKLIVEKRIFIYRQD